MAVRVEECHRYLKKAWEKDMTEKLRQIYKNPELLRRRNKPEIIWQRNKLATKAGIGMESIDAKEFMIPEQLKGFYLENFLWSINEDSRRNGLRT